MSARYRLHCSIYTERQENENLLHLSCPVSPTNALSRRSSVATVSAPSSPLDLYSARFQGPMPSVSPFFNATEVAVAGDGILSEAVVKNCEQSSSHLGIQQHNDRRRKRSYSALERGNKVTATLSAAISAVNSAVDESKTDKMIPDADIAMPAFLPLPRHTVTRQDFDAAFEEGDAASPLPVASSNSLGHHFDKKGVRRPTFLRLETSNASERRRASRPLSQDGGAAEREQLGKSTFEAPGLEDFASADPLVKRRGSSLDMSPRACRRMAGLALSEKESASPSPTAFHWTRSDDQWDSPGRNRQTTRHHKCTPVDPARAADSAAAEQTKAASQLGITANNASLLVPGGLGTGEHVYDGIEIMCRSVHLPSDDDESDDEGTGASADLGLLGSSSRRRVKGWLRAKRKTVMPRS